MSVRLALLFAAASLCAAPSEVMAQQKSTCAFVCKPAVVVQYGMNRSHLRGGPRVRSLSTGNVHRLPSSTNQLIALVTTATTAIPHVGLLAAVSWLPTATARANPYTAYTASEIGESKVRSNSPVLTMGATLSLVDAEQLGGWASLSANVADQFGPAARPNDEASYTHKLDLQGVVTAMPFAKVPAHVWAHGISLVGILDFVATGLPRAGDEVPAGERVYVDNARPLDLSVVVSLPIATGQ